MTLTIHLTEHGPTRGQPTAILKDLRFAAFPEPVCVSRAGRGRAEHEPCKDGRCIYCGKVVEA